MSQQQQQHQKHQHHHHQSIDRRRPRSATEVQQHQQQRYGSKYQSWAPTRAAAVLLSLLLGKCHGFTVSSSKPFSITAAPALATGYLRSYPHRHPHTYKHLSPPPTRHAREATRARGGGAKAAMMVGARVGGYGRFSGGSDDYGNVNYNPSESSSDAGVGGGGETGKEWEEIGNADVLIPRGVEYPLGVVHFVGGQGVGVFPKNTYGTLLEALVDAGFLVVATRVRFNEFNHEELACEVARDFGLAFREVEALYGTGAMRRVPLFGVGHSLGAKLHVLMNCYPEVLEVAKRRKANVIISFNNFPAKDSVPFINELRELGESMGDLGPLGDNISGIAKAVAGLPVVSGIAAQGLSLAGKWAPKAAAAVESALSDVPQEFKPSPQVTWDLLVDQYSVRNNLVVQFKGDTIDQSPQLAETLFNRFGRDGELEFSRLQGTHVTPNTPDFRDTRQARDWASKAGLGAQGDAFVEGGAKVASSTASLEMDELIRTLVSYLRSQSLWVRQQEGRWDSDEM